VPRVTVVMLQATYSVQNRYIHSRTRRRENRKGRRENDRKRPIAAGKDALREPVLVLQPKMYTLCSYIVEHGKKTKEKEARGRN